MEFTPSGVCSRLIKIDLDGETIKKVEFVGGCAGNTQGIASLVAGMNVHDAISRMEGRGRALLVDSSPHPALTN